MKKKILFIIAVFFLVPPLIVLAVNLRVVTFSSVYIISPDHIVDYDAVLVPGAQVKSGGRLSNILYDRLRTALAVHRADPSLKILVSGDNGSQYYDEVNAMRNYLISMDVEPYYIFMDHAGFNTYDSMYRAKNIYKTDKILIVTQRYHLYRAVYNARKMGIDAYGLPSDRREYAKIRYFTAREIAARVKDFVLVNFIRPEPAYLGEPIPIWKDGRLTIERPDMPYRE